ncbi:hypothetical protein CYMTET_28010 [Cymbomonas tetramitiformis]|uniref:Uncharacterized protein n=1 Tax=Cymbomonas tetramitiformis TaxID=36881 RepID=A0AAE0FNT9_9CHLO|nr:hypothetical protein CYMTET_28010 [Cymbomonas tetramitiformis]
MALYIDESASVHEETFCHKRLPQLIPADEDPDKYIQNPQNPDDYHNYFDNYEKAFDTLGYHVKRLGIGTARCVVPVMESASVSENGIRQKQVVLRRCKGRCNSWSMLCGPAHQQVLNSLLSPNEQYPFYFALHKMPLPGLYADNTDNLFRVAKLKHEAKLGLHIAQHADATTSVEALAQEEKVIAFDLAATALQNRHAAAANRPESRTLSLSPPPTVRRIALAASPAKDPNPQLLEQLQELELQLKKLATENADLKKQFQQPLTDLHKQNADLTAQNKNGFAQLQQAVAENEQLKRQNAEWSEKHTILVQQMAVLTNVPADLEDFEES